MSRSNLGNGSALRLTEPRSAAARFMESSVFLSDLLTGHEPDNRKYLEINGAIFRLPRKWVGRGVLTAPQVAG